MSSRRPPGKADLALLKDPDELLEKYMLLKVRLRCDRALTVPQDENMVLKKHNNEQEDKIKKCPPCRRHMC